MCMMYECHGCRNGMGCFVQGVKFLCNVLTRVAEMAWNVLSRV